MTKYLSIFILATVVAFSCSKKKDSEPPPVVPPPVVQIEATDAKAVSTAVKVWHGERKTGTPPAPNNNPDGPELDPASDDQTITAVQGRYAVIVPQVSSGEVAGYYIGINGATEYFKIDYSKPIGRSRIATNAKRDNVLRRSARSTGNEDSALIIQVPINIKPGKFCATYCAYDAAGNISQPIEVCITVASFGGDAASTFLIGEWKWAGGKDSASQVWVGGEGVRDSSFNQYQCYNNRLTYNCPTSSCPWINVPDYIADVKKDRITFATNGGFGYAYQSLDYDLIEDSSTCSNFRYREVPDNFTSQGGWSYNSSTKRLTLVFEFENGIPASDWYDTRVVIVNSTEIHLVEDDKHTTRLLKL